MSDIRDAWATYQDAQSTAEEAYEEFWRQTFLANGLAFQKKDYTNSLTIKNWGVTFSVYPRQYQGVRVELYDNNNTNPFSNRRRIKIRAEIGLKRFLRTLDAITK